MRERINGYIFHQVTEFDDEQDDDSYLKRRNRNYYKNDFDEEADNDGNYEYCNVVLIFTFVVYEQINSETHIAYGIYPEISETHEMIHQLAQSHEDEFWDLLPEDNNEPIGGGLINLKTGISRVSNNFGHPTPEVMRAVNRFLSENEEIMCDWYFN